MCPISGDSEASPFLVPLPAFRYVFFVYVCKPIHFGCFPQVLMVSTKITRFIQNRRQSLRHGFSTAIDPIRRNAITKNNTNRSKKNLLPVQKKIFFVIHNFPLIGPFMPLPCRLDFFLLIPNLMQGPVFDILHLTYPGSFVPSPF